MKKFILILLSFIVLQANALTLDKHPQVQAYIKQIAKEYNFSQKQLDKWFSQAQIDQVVINKMNSPYEAKPWYEYKNLFVSNSRIENGVKFWQRNEKVLNEAYKKYGVSPDIIVAIVGIETRYGEYKGNFSVFNTLTTLSFDYPKRAKFFKRELTQFLLLAREQKWDVFTIKGSYAGAIGYPQFMPSSYRHYAVDFTGNGKIDLIHNEDDVIGSVANYLAKHGWQRNGLIAVKANTKGNAFKKLPTNERKPKYSLAKLKTYNVTPATNIKTDGKALFFELQTAKDQPEYLLGFKNFYAITRYNTSKKYAMAVYTLAEKIKAAKQAESKK